VEVLETGASDEEVAIYAEDNARPVLTYDDDLIDETDMSGSAGVVLQVDRSLSAKETSDVVHEISRYMNQKEIELEYVSSNWL
jgi:predicted nuclease of predicted toxin-antitoxin system